MAIHYTRAEVAIIIEQFLNGTDGPWDWDDFTSIRIDDPELDAIRRRCGELYDEPNHPGQYCGPDGVAEMRRMIEHLRS